MDKTMQLKSSNRPMIAALLLFAITLLGLVFYVKPLWEDVNSLALGRDDKLSQKKELQDELTNLQKLQETLNLSSEVSRETSLASIPEKLEEEKLIVELADMAQKSDIALNSVNFGIPTSAPAGDVARVTMNANLTGTESSLVGFLRAVEANPRKIVVKSITVQLGETETGVTLANFNVNMEAYYQGVI